MLETSPPIPTYDIPGPEGRRVVAAESATVTTGTKTAPIVVKRASGLLVEDVDGNVFLDFTSGMVAATGHSHPKVAEAIAEQAERWLFINSPDFYSPLQAEVAERLVRLVPGLHSKKVFLCNSGTEANEAAIKATRWNKPTRKRLIAFIGAFHGRTMGANSMTASKIAQRARFTPNMPDVHHLPYATCYRCPYKMTYPNCDIWCARILEELYFKQLIPPDEVSAIFVEPIQGEGGYIVPPPEWVPIIRDIASRYGIAYVDDEVQAGMGKTGKMLAIEHFGVTANCTSLGKALGSGVAVAATVLDADLDFGEQGAHSNTFGGNGIALAAAKATLDVMEEERLVERAAELGGYFIAKLRELQERFVAIGDVRGKGLMLAVDFVTDRASRTPDPAFRDRVLKRCFLHGLMLLPCGFSALRFTPALVVDRTQIDRAVDILERAIREA
ncbi:MAG: aspartate aminotransferase family protein [Candidatus Eremiobacter antarcticus]|nr:aminotransferase class III-fold pyridoxal phosphate-dependent enzyme [Candidatus Eremiobacteraeota bacterium]MBC5807364.1 aminotransferase class III-fold pyridoxal phosphate-dependent enzyme [Candidatus Eremiobacteraeota bacterium]PZR63117.1 MAG: aspartate aminotransferase family protein [Candidatus Eremiobacter sp. RRmetagenome_bin22]